MFDNLLILLSILRIVLYLIVNYLCALYDNINFDSFFLD